MNPRVIAGGVLASLWLLGLPTWAVEYRLQVVNLDAITVLAHLDNSGQAPHGEARQSRLEVRLDNGGFSAAAALPGRHVHLLPEPGDGGQPLAWPQVLPRARDSVWTTLQWEGHPGDRVVFVVRSEMRAWQGVAAVAANPEGVLRRLVIGSGGVVRTLTAGGPRGRGRLSRQCRGPGHLPAVGGAERPGAERHVSRGRSRSERL